MARRKGKLRNELILVFAIVTLIPLMIAAYKAVDYFVEIVNKKAQDKVANDLVLAEHIYEEIKSNLKYIVRDQNRAVFFRLRRGELRELKKHLGEVIWRKGLSFFTVTDEHGKVVLRVSNPNAVGDDLSGEPLVKKALKDETIVSTEVFFEEELKREGLSEKAKIDLVETVGAKPTTKKVETRGLVLKAIMPVKDEVNRIVGVMCAGYLLNRNNSIVDLISEKTGTKATIFLGDTRITTNILNLDGTRALGTRIHADVAKEVLELGKRYFGRAWVVNAWYLTAYEPIRDSKNKIVGILYVGEPETPYIVARNKMILGFGLTLGFGLLIAGIFGFLSAKRIVRPVDQLRHDTEIIGKGNLEHKVVIRATNEIGDLADAFNKMTEDLKNVREELVRKERLAAIGEMAASLAHELKNSLTGIKVATFYVSKKVAPEKPELLKNFKAIETEVERGTRTVSNILYFSHPVKPALQLTNLNNLIEEVISQGEELALLGNIEISKNLDYTLPAVMLAPEPFKQVITNLIRNSSEAMPKGGKITITTRMIIDQFAEIQVEDTGCGIPEENLEKIFTPFFTTKSDGLGLGLAVVKTVIDELQGKIEVESKINQGTTFVIKLPLSRENQGVAGKIRE